MTCAHEHISEGDPIVSLTAHLAPDGAVVHLVLTYCPSIDDAPLKRLEQLMRDGLSEAISEGAQREQ